MTKKEYIRHNPFNPTTKELQKSAWSDDTPIVVIGGVRRTLGKKQSGIVHSECPSYIYILLPCGSWYLAFPD